MFITLTGCELNSGPDRCLVQRSNVIGLIRNKVHLVLHVEHTEWRVHDAFDGVCDHHFFLIPAESIHEHPMKQDVILWGWQLPTIKGGH